MRLPKTEFIGTGAWFFLLVNLIKVPFSADLGLINPMSLKLNLLRPPSSSWGPFWASAWFDGSRKRSSTSWSSLFAAIGRRQVVVV
jgi:hypothetical protein